MRFDDFCKNVAHADVRLSLQQESPIRYVTDGLVEFVAPKLSPRRDVDLPPTPKVLVISAAGAVGKSTLARELSLTANLPYWDLAEYGPVGQGTIGGAILASVGFGGMNQVHSGLSTGHLAFVVDALDEARVKVNESSFEAFVRDLAQSAQTAPTVSFVLFGRNQIAETTWLILEDEGIDVGFYVIEPFDRDEARTYVDRRVAQLDTEAAARMQTHPQPYRDARELLLDGLERAIAGSQPNDAAIVEARDFVGYAPVLEAVSVLLSNEPNLGLLRTRLESALNDGITTDEPSRPVALLKHVVAWILEREHEAKLVANIKPALQSAADQSGWSDWESLYTAEEQCERLVAKLLDISYQSSGGLPGPLVAQYEQQLAAFLPEHPFLREGNSVFTSFLFVRSLLDGGDQADAVEAHLSSKTYKPSSLLADFYFLETQSENDEVLSLPPKHVGLLYDSLVASESDQIALRTTIEGDLDVDNLPKTTVDGEFELVNLTTLDDDEPRILSHPFITTVRPNDSFRFRRYLRDTTIAAPCIVEVGSGDSEFVIGPTVSIRARTLRLPSSTIIAGGRTKQRELGEEHDNGVVLEAENIESSVIERPVAHVELTVSWPGCEAFPWSAHASAIDREITEDDRLRTAFRRFRRIVMTLRSHSKGSLARVKHKIEHARVLKGSIGDALLRQLVTDGILVLRGNFYHLVTEQADALTGISWMDLRHGRSSERLRTYLHTFVQANAQLFA